MESDVFDVISGILEKANRYAVLFIGSGLSRRYLHTPGWVGLLKGLASNVLEDDMAYSRAMSNALHRLGLDRSEQDDPRVLPEVASLISERVDDALLSSNPKERLADFCNRHHDELSDGFISPTKLYISEQLGSFTLVKDEWTDEIAELKAASSKISDVITTNYDRLCESLFPSFIRYIGQRELIFSEPSYEGELFQIHGSCDQPNSLVLTSADYRAFESQESYLVAKLLTMFMEHPVIFLGYSISDTNIQAILASLSRCVGPEGLEYLRNRMVFIEHKCQGEAEVGEALFTFGTSTLAMTRVSTNDFSPIYKAVAQSTRLYDTKILRMLRGSIYEIVNRLDSASKIRVADIDSALEKLDPDERIIIGFDVGKGKVGMPLNAAELYREWLDDAHGYPHDVMYANVESLLPQNSGGLPVYKYLDGAPPEGISDRLQDYLNLHDSVDSFRSKSDRRAAASFKTKYPQLMHFDAMIEAFDGPGAARRLIYLDESELEPERIRSYVLDVISDDSGEVDLEYLVSGGLSSYLKKLIRIADYLEYSMNKDNG